MEMEATEAKKTAKRDDIDDKIQGFLRSRCSAASHRLPLPGPRPRPPPPPLAYKMGSSTTSEELRKEQAAAHVMTTLKPFPADGAAATNQIGAASNAEAARKLGAAKKDGLTIVIPSLPATASPSKAKVQEPPPKKKKKQAKISSASAPSSVPPSSPFSDLDDNDFVRTVAVEFRRRGFTVALQLGAAAAADAGDGEETEDGPTKETTPSTTGHDCRGKYPAFPFYPSSVTTSPAKRAAWDAMFDRLRAHHSQNDGALPLQHDPAHAALCKWTKSQLTLWKRLRKDGKHNLSLERIGKLHSLDLERCARRQLETQQCALSSRLQGPDGAGGAPGSEDAPPPLGRNKQKWLDKFEELRRHKELLGDTDVARNRNTKLSKWCAVQRRRCKEVANGDTKSLMTQAQYQALESIGFEMSRKRKHYDRAVLDKKWEEKFAELVRYKEKTGNCDAAVRKGFEEYKQLANWAGLQRRKYKAKQTGTQTGRTTEITNEQIKKLASIGFSFTLQDDFDTRFNNLLEFKKEFGHTKVPVFFTGYGNLGRWAKRMRDGIRTHEHWVDDVQKSRLLGIDFDIAARRVFGHKPKKAPADAEDEAAAAGLDGVDAGDAGSDVDAVKEHAILGDDTAEVVEEAKAVAAATTMARMDTTDFGRPSFLPFGNTTDFATGPQFFYHGYPTEQP